MGFPLLAAFLYNVFSWFCVFRHPYVAADDRSFADGDAAEYGGIAVDDDVVFEYGVACDAFDGVSVIVKGKALGTEGDALIEFHVVANDASGSNDDACAVVDGEVVPYLCARMDVDACLAVCDLCDDAWYERYAEQQQLMCYPIAGDGFDDRVAADDFAIGAGSRIAVVGCLNVGCQYAAHVGQALDELCHDGLCLFCERTGGFGFVVLEAKSCQYLLGEEMAEFVQADADMVGQGLAADVGFPVEPGEYDSAAKVDDLTQCRGGG